MSKPALQPTPTAGQTAAGVPVGVAANVGSVTREGVDGGGNVITVQYAVYNVSEYNDPAAIYYPGDNA